MIKVLVVDDHAIVRRGVLQILAEAPEMRVTGEARTAQEALRLARETVYDVVILDIALPDGSGLEVLKQLQSLKPAPRVLILSIYPEEQYAIRVLKLGAMGYLTKDSAPDELITAIRKVAQGGKYVTLSLAERLADKLSLDTEKAPHELLSDREYQVMCLLAAGKTITEIAAELSLSPKTASTYRTRILEKLNLQNTAEIMRYALHQGLVE
ncbi:MAG: response regulator transcription factor [Anaerolineae bacterium]